MTTGIFQQEQIIVTSLARTASAIELGQFTGVDSDTLIVKKHKVDLFEGRGWLRLKIRGNRLQDCLSGHLLREASPARNPWFHHSA